MIMEADEHDEEKRPTLAELAAAANGLGCPKCGCRDTRVIKTRHDAEGVQTIRRRVCRNCGNRMNSVESLL